MLEEIQLQRQPRPQRGANSEDGFKLIVVSIGLPTTA